jgi:bifunctional isochorismate lyase/aryl carrier protein
MTVGLPTSAAALQAQIADLLDELADSFGPDDDLIDVGLDSIRLMTLVERWRSGGVRLDFADLAEQPTVNGWWALMTAEKENAIR